MGQITSITPPGKSAVPFTFQGWTLDSQTGLYYTGSGYCDPATVKSSSYHGRKVGSFTFDVTMNTCGYGGAGSDTEGCNSIPDTLYPHIFFPY